MRGTLKDLLSLLYMLLTEPQFAQETFNATIDMQAVRRTLTRGIPPSLSVPEFSRMCFSVCQPSMVSFHILTSLMLGEGVAFTQVGHQPPSSVSMAFDGQYLYIYSGPYPSIKLLKVGSGHKGAVLC